MECGAVTKPFSKREADKKNGTSTPIIGCYEWDEIKPSIEMAGKIAGELDVSVDYLLGGSALVADKRLLKRIEEIEALIQKEKDKVYYFLYMAITYNKTKKAFARQMTKPLG